MESKLEVLGEVLNGEEDSLGADSILDIAQVCIECNRFLILRHQHQLWTIFLKRFFKMWKIMKKETKKGRKD